MLAPVAILKLRNKWWPGGSKQLQELLWVFPLRVLHSPDLPAIDPRISSAKKPHFSRGAVLPACRSFEAPQESLLKLVRSCQTKVATSSPNQQVNLTAYCFATFCHLTYTYLRATSSKVPQIRRPSYLYRYNQKRKKVPHLSTTLILTITLLISSGVQANDVEKTFLKAGLIDVNHIDGSIRVDLVNSDSEKNFFEEDFYKGLNKAYLRKEVAVKLSKAQLILKKEKPNYSLQVLDAARPRSVSRDMYEKMKGTRFERYVANPNKGSMHNYGIAVDITIVDENGNKLDMGPSPFYSSHAEIYWQYFLKRVGFDISTEQKENRALLRRVMSKAGFYPLLYEWWHFNGMRKEDARNTFSIIE